MHTWGAGVPPARVDGGRSRRAKETKPAEGAGPGVVATVVIAPVVTGPALQGWAKHGAWDVPDDH